MKYLFLLVCAMFFIACGPTYIYEREIAVTGPGWTYPDSLVYEFELTDTAAVYNLFLDITHSPEYAYQNLYTRLLTDFPNGRRLEQVLSLELADKTGTWNGDCGSSSCTVRIPLQEKAYFALTGPYRITVHQHMRKESLPGVQALGLAIERTELTR